MWDGATRSWQANKLHECVFINADHSSARNDNLRVCTGSRAGLGQVTAVLGLRQRGQSSGQRLWAPAPHDVRCDSANMDKQDFAQIKRQQEASEAPAGSQDYSGAMRFRWGGLAQERPLPPFGAMSMHMARKFNRKLLDERCPLGNEKPVRRLSLAASTAMLRPGSAAAARRGAHSPKKKNKKKKKSRGLSSDEAFHRATSSLLDR